MNILILRGSAAPELKNRNFDEEFGPLSRKSSTFDPPAKSLILRNVGPRRELGLSFSHLQTDRIKSRLAKYIKLIDNLSGKNTLSSFEFTDSAQ